MAYLVVLRTFIQVFQCLKRFPLKIDDYPSISEDQWFAKIKKELKIESLEELDAKHGFAINPLLRDKVDNAVVERTDNQWKFGLVLKLEDAKTFNTKLKKLLGWGMTAFQVHISATELDLETAFEGIFLEMIYPSLSSMMTIRSQL